MKRKAVYTVSALALGFAAMGAFVACGGEEGDGGDKVDGTKGLEYKLTNDEQSYIVSLPDEGNWENADIVIPATYRGKPVTEIESHGFSDSTIKSVKISDSVKKIGGQAFDDCKNLKTVDFGKGVTEIDNFAFKNTGLETLILPASVTTIGNQVFQQNEALTSVKVLGNAVFGSFAFDRCPALTKVEFLGEESLSLGAQAFSNSPLMKDLTIAAEDVTFAYNTFFDSNLIRFAATLETIYKADFTSNTTPPQELVFLRTETFANKTPVSPYGFTVTSITLPATLKACEDGAFSTFRNLETVAYEGTVADWCGIEFESRRANPLNRGAELKIGGNAVEGKLTVPAGVEKINDYAFTDCKTITELEVFEGVKEIGEYAFCASSVQTARLPESLTKIGLNAFSSCALYSVNLPEGLTEIGKQAFEWCRLVNVTLPASLQTLGENAFVNNRMMTRMVNQSSLTEQQIAKGINPQVSDSQSKRFELLTEADASEVEKVGDFLFWKDENGYYFLMGYLGNAKEITLPAKVHGERYAIHAHAFDNTSLEKISFEDTANWHTQFSYNQAEPIDVTDSVQNATKLQETSYNRCEWYQIFN